MSFPKRVRELREKNGWTPQQLADAVGASRSAVNFWEDPKGDEMFPHAKTMTKLAKVLGVSESWLRFGDITNFQPKDYIFSIAKTSKTHIIPYAPILKITEIGGWIESKRTLMQKGMQMSAEEIKAVCFRYEIEGDSMLSMTDPIRSLVPGEVVLVDPLCVGGLKSGDLVLAQYGMTDDFKARTYNRDGLDSYLSAVNQLVPHVAVNDNVKIIGKIVASERNR